VRVSDDERKKFLVGMVMDHNRKPVIHVIIVPPQVQYFSSKSLLKLN
jgi:hypothetical protein